MTIVDQIKSILKSMYRGEIDVNIAFKFVVRAIFSLSLVSLNITTVLLLLLSLLENFTIPLTQHLLLSASENLPLLN